MPEGTRKKSLLHTSEENIAVEKISQIFTALIK